MSRHEAESALTDVHAEAMPDLVTNATEQQKKNISAYLVVLPVSGSLVCIQHHLTACLVALGFGGVALTDRRQMH